MFHSDLLAGKRVLVTGGGTGLGRSIGRRAVELGATLTICGRRTEVLQQAAAEFDALGRQKTRGLACDIREPDQVAAMMDAVWAEGPLDVLVNNAAGTMLARTETLSARAVDAVLRVSLNGALHTTLEAGRRWIEGGHHGGTLMYTLAGGFDDGRPFMVPVEWGRHGIRTVGVAPGNFPTPGAAAKLQTGRTADPALEIPLGRVGEHRELADLYAFLMSDLAGFITGEVITIDGGKGLRTNGVDDLFAWSPAQWDALRPKK